MRIRRPSIPGSVTVVYMALAVGVVLYGRHLAGVDGVLNVNGSNRFAIAILDGATFVLLFPVGLLIALVVSWSQETDRLPGLIDAVIPVVAIVLNGVFIGYVAAGLVRLVHLRARRSAASVAPRQLNHNPRFPPGASNLRIRPSNSRRAAGGKSGSASALRRASFASAVAPREANNSLNSK